MIDEAVRRNWLWASRDMADSWCDGFDPIPRRETVARIRAEFARIVREQKLRRYGYNTATGAWTEYIGSPV